MNRLNLFLIKLQASAASESVFKLCELPFDRFRCKIPQLIHPTNCLQMGLMFWSPWHICLDKKAKFWICKTSRYKPCRSWCALQSRFIAARFYREVSLAYCGFAGLHWTCDVCLTARRLFGRNTNDFDSIQTWWNIKPIWRTYIWQNWRNNKKTSYSCHPCVFGQNHTLFVFFLHWKITSSCIRLRAVAHQSSKIWKSHWALALVVSGRCFQGSHSPKKDQKTVGVGFKHVFSCWCLVEENPIWLMVLDMGW